MEVILEIGESAAFRITFLINELTVLSVGMPFSLGIDGLLYA